MKTILEIIKIIDKARDKIKANYLYNTELDLWSDIYDGLLYEAILELQEHGTDRGEKICYLPREKK